jgi:hypothetical protein
VALLVLPDGRKLKLCYSGEKDFLKKKLSSVIIFKCNEEWWMVKMSRSNPERGLGQNSRFTSGENGNARWICFCGSLNCARETQVK